jgi:hypothetical protein
MDLEVRGMTARKKTIKAMLPIVAAPKYRGEAEAVGPYDG